MSEATNLEKTKETLRSSFMTYGEELMKDRRSGVIAPEDWIKFIRAGQALAELPESISWKTPIVNSLPDFRGLTWFINDEEKVLTPEQLVVPLNTHFIENMYFVEKLIDDLEKNSKIYDNYYKLFTLSVPEIGVDGLYSVQVLPHFYDDEPEYGIIKVETQITIVSKVRIKIETQEKIIEKEESQREY